MDFWEVNNFNIINYFLWLSSTSAFAVFSSCAAGVPLSIVVRSALFKGAKCRRRGDFLTENFFINKNASHKNISSKSILNIKAESTKIVVFNSLNISSTLGIRLTQFNRNNSYLFKKIKEQIIGHLLGDGSLKYHKTSINPSFTFVQTIKRLNYFLFSYLNLSHYCQNKPNITFSVRKGTKIGTLYYVTRSYPFLKNIHSLFYYEKNNSWIKHISYDLCFYLTPKVLAFWFMDDGSSATGGSGLYLHTKGFTFEDVYKLAAMLHYMFGLTVTVQNHENRPVNYIPAKSLILIKQIITPYMHPSMFYKFDKLKIKQF